MAYNHTQLVNALTAAQKAAQSQRHTEDGGTCNFDTAVFRLNGLRRTTVEKAAEEAGVQISVRKWFGGLYCFVEVGQGQGNRRTRMAEAAEKALEANGIKSTVYYQMD